MSLEQLRIFLTDLTTVAYVALAVVSILRWQQSRTKSWAWLALTFVCLGGILLLGRMLPEDPTAFPVVRRISLAVFLLFPYFLFRFSASFQPPRPSIDIVASGLTVAVIVWGFFVPLVPRDAPRPVSLRLWIMALLVQWVTLSLIVSVRLWRQGSTTAAQVAKRRMRLMSGAAALLSLDLVVAGSAENQPEGLRVITSLVALCAAAAFYLGFSPPEFIRTRWRRPALEAVRAATGELLTARSEQEVTGRLLPHLADIVGARGVAFFNAEGKIIDHHGVTPEMLGATAGHLEGQAEEEEVGDLLIMRYPFGALALWTSPYAPFFGTEEFALLRSLGNLAHLALEQTRAAELKLQVAESRLKRKQALEINDNIVQGLTVAKYAFELGDDQKAKAALDGSLTAAKRIISDLLDELEPDDRLRAGALIREQPASPPPPA